ncbi:MAG: hypothetical protein OYL92_17710 [Acidobacteriota bacterium]|nr:hypothetical protein [Acidobacteriota bacterium]MDE3266802.1 hypothetical protein [Acidobacteriota bacterium]
MPRSLRLTLTILALAAASPAGIAADGLTAYRGSAWAHLQATSEPPILWLGTERSVELPAAGATVASHYDDLVLLDPQPGGPQPDGGAEWAVAGVARGANGPRFLLYAGRDGEVTALPAPERTRPENRLVSAQWLAAGGPEPLHGLAWLEASRPRGQEVWLAPWRDGAFEPAVRLVADGPGSQTALDAAVLTDGSWLLVWCAFDGEDDELVWRHRQPAGDWVGGRVSPDNGVPDITPRLLVTRDGAAVAWSRYDGSVYRVRTARFEDGRWSDEDWAGPPDSLYPEWAGADDTLLYLEGATRTWTAAGPASTLRFEAATSTTPVLDRDPASGLLRALWPGTSGWRAEPGRPAGARP